MFRLHALLHEAAGAVRAHSGKGPGYWYKIGRGPNSCLLAHMTGLLFCLYVKPSLPFFFNSVDFWSSRSLIVLNIELTEKISFKDLYFLLMVLSKDFNFVYQRLLNLKNRQHGTQVTCMELRGVVESWILRSFCCFLRHKSNECRSVC